MPPPAVAAVPSVDTNTELTHDYRFQPWVVCFSASLFFFFEFIQLNMFNALNPALIRAFNVSATQLAHLSAMYFYATVIFLFPAGMILDRVSTRKVIVITMFAAVLCTFGFAASRSLWQAEICRFITGVSGAFVLLSNVRLASRWFEPRRMALVVGLIVTFAMLGGMVAQTPLTLLTDSIGWRLTLMIDGIVGLFMLGMIIVFVRDFPKRQANVYAEQQALLQGIGFWQALFQTVRNSQNWLGGLYTSLMNLPIFLLGAMWGIMYLVQVQGLNRANASFVTSMLFIGTIIGSPVMGWFSDRIRRRRSPMIGGAVIALGLVLILMYVPHLSMITLLFIFFGLGFITSAQIISYPLIAESNPLALTGTAEGLASVLIMAGGFTQPLFASLMQWHWAHRYINKLPIYSVSNYRTALAIMPIAFILGLIIAFIIRETYCMGYRESEQNKHN